MMKTVRLLVIDQTMSATEIEINQLQFKSLGIDKNKITKHHKKRSLNKTITEFLESFEEENDALQNKSF